MMSGKAILGNIIIWALALSCFRHSAHSDQPLVVSHEPRLLTDFMFRLCLQEQSRSAFKNRWM